MILAILLSNELGTEIIYLKWSDNLRKLVRSYWMRKVCPGKSATFAISAVKQ